MAIVVAGVMGGTLVLLVGTANGMQLPRAQSEMAADLRSGDPDRIGLALAEMAAVSPTEWKTELRGALLEALEREIEYGAFGEDPHVAVYPMFNLAMEVAGLGDARAAPVLARHGGFGWERMDMLVSLGEPGLVLYWILRRRPSPLWSTPASAAISITSALWRCCISLCTNGE